MLFVKPGHLCFDKSHSQQIEIRWLGEGKMATPVLEAEAEVNPDVLLYKATAIGKGGHD